MKILFVDESSNLQEKWIEPLRGEGWGVVRARSTEDAEKIFEFHGDSLSAIVVSETFADWAEKWNYPYIVFLKTWKENQVLKHQNTSAHAAVAYLEFDTNLELVKQALQQNMLKATGTSPVSRAATPVAPLEVVAPAQESSPQESVVISFEKYADQKEEPAQEPVAETQPEIVLDQQDNDRTMMFESTTALSELNLSENVEEFITEKADFDEIEEHVEDAPVIESIEEPVIADEAPAVSYSSNFSTAGNKDLETMKNYLALREQDVALLTGQMRSTQERVQQLENQLKMERARSGELQQTVQKQEQQIRNFDRDKQVEFEVLYQQVEDLNLQLRERTDKVRTIEAKLKITTDEVEKVKERVRVDIRRIRVREKELESQLEILKKDSTALLVARDEKIIELKRKIDLLEFNMELVQEQYGKERNQTEQLRHKLKEAAGVMKRAGGLLDHEN